MTKFITLLAQKVRPGGIVCILPYYGQDLRSVWRKNGFEPFYETDPDNPASFYTFKGRAK